MLFRVLRTNSIKDIFTASCYCFKLYYGFNLSLMNNRKSTLTISTFLPLVLLVSLFLGSCERGPDNEEPLEPANPSGTLFIATHITPGSVQSYWYALDAATGEIKWSKYRTGFLNTPTIANGKLFYRNTFYLESLDTTTHDINVVANLTEPHGGPPTFYENRVYVKDGAGEKAFDAATGTMSFFASTGSGDDRSAATIENGVLVSSKANLWGVHPGSGNILWWNGDIFPDNAANPAVANGMAYVPAKVTADFYAVNTTSGELVWDYHFTDAVSMSGSYCSGSPTVKNGKVFFASFDSTVFALNAASGALVWKKALNGGIAFSSPVISGSSLFIVAKNYLYSLNINSGDVKWSVQGPFGGDPVYSNGCIFIQAGTKIICCNASDGTTIWEKNINYPFSNSILVVDKNKNVYRPGISGELN